MKTQTVQTQILVLEAKLKTLLGSSATPNFSERKIFLQGLIDTLKTAQEDIKRYREQSIAQAAELDKMAWSLNNEISNKEDTQRLNRDYIHRMQTAGINYSPYQF